MNTTIERHDPYTLRGIEQIFSVYDGGEFLKAFLEGHEALLLAMSDHKDEHGGEVKGSFNINVKYQLGKHGEILMAASSDFKEPKKPASSAAAFVDENGQLTLFSPLMARMHTGPQTVKETPHDPVTGEVIDTPYEPIKDAAND